MNKNDDASMNALLEEQQQFNGRYSKAPYVFQELGPWGYTKVTEDLLSYSRKRLEETSALTNKISQEQRLVNDQRCQFGNEKVQKFYPSPRLTRRLTKEKLFANPALMGEITPNEGAPQLQLADFTRPRRLKSLHTPRQSKLAQLNAEKDILSCLLVERSNTIPEVLEDNPPQEEFQAIGNGGQDNNTINDYQIQNRRQLKANFAELTTQKQSEMFKKKLEMVLQVTPFSRISGSSTPIADKESNQQQQQQNPIQINTLLQSRTPRRRIRNNQRNYHQILSESNNFKCIISNQNRTSQDKEQQTTNSYQANPLKITSTSPKNASFSMENDQDKPNCFPILSRFPLIAIGASRKVDPPIAKSQQMQISKRMVFSKQICLQSGTPKTHSYQSSLNHSPTFNGKKSQIFQTPW